jgi:dihydrofolate synthase/folylpolyglutamate synthase
MTYKDTLEYLYHRLPMFSRVGAVAYKEDLHNTLELCASLGNPHTQIKTIHIAGTNGKGSVSHMLAAILQCCGYRTGLYTSPHLKDFRERIRIDGAMVNEDFVTTFTGKVMPMIDRISPSFFEITVAMAFDHFAENRVDVAVIETGLGGRLDSTNVIIPELSVITNIGWDHMNILGNTISAIASEKAGIIKQNIPVVIGETDPETEKVFRDTAVASMSPIHFADSQWEILNAIHNGRKLDVQVRHIADGRTSGYELDLTGIYQMKNLLTVLEAVDQLRNIGWKIPDDKLRSGLSQTKKLTGLHGRWELIRERPMLVADVAHNEPGMRQLIAQISATPHRQLHIVMGMVRDKDISSVLKILPRNATYYFTMAGIERALPVGDLKEMADRYGLNGNAYPNVNIAIDASLSAAAQEDLIVVCGSIFIVGEIDLLHVD